MSKAPSRYEARYRSEGPGEDEAKNEKPPPTITWLMIGKSPDRVRADSQDPRVKYAA